MPYFIYRNDQQYGPYSLQDLQAQVASGTMVAADQARDAQGGPLTTVGEVLSTVHQGFISPAATAQPIASGTPLPPNLHWAIVLLIGVVFSPFTLAWHIYQMVWIRKIDPASKALLYFGLGFGSFVLLFAIGMLVIFHDPNNPNALGALPLALGGLSLFVFMVMNVFDMRRSLVEYYNTVEPIGLRLSGVMTFFFNIYYFQYHMSRIAAWKTTGYLAPQG